MKGIKKAADRSKHGRTALYYSYKTDSIYTENAAGRYFVTYLIRENTPEEVKAAVMRWKNL